MTTPPHTPRLDVLTILAEDIASHMDDAIKAIPETTSEGHPLREHLRDAFAEVGALLRELGYNGTRPDVTD